jgi:hypothetical protein
MPTRTEALSELQEVFRMLETEYHNRRLLTRAVQQGLPSRDRQEACTLTFASWFWCYIPDPGRLSSDSYLRKK